MLSTLLAVHLVLTQDITIDEKAQAVVDAYSKAWASTNSVQFRMRKTEWQKNGRPFFEDVTVKFKKPGNVYMFQHSPNKGQEALYVPGKDAKNLTAHPGSFPDVTVTLDVGGGMATKNQHHPIFHSGFTYALSIIENALADAKKDPKGEKLEYGGEVTVNGRVGELVRVTSGGRAPKKVQAKAGESLLDFAKRVNQDPFVIVMANADLSDLSSDLEAGKTYTVPAYYATKCEFVIDKEFHLPLKQTIFIGDKGDKDYEKTEFLDYKINPSFTDADFSKDNKAYGF